VLAGVSLQGALSLRFEGNVPEYYRGVVPLFVTLLVVVRLLANAAARIHCWSFRTAGLPDAVRVAFASLAGSLVFVALGRELAPGGLPRTVYALEFFLTTSAMGALRFGPRLALRWWGEQARRRAGADRTLIVGVNPAAELLARDINCSTQTRYDLVGFVATDSDTVGRRLDGKPILGTLAELPRIIAQQRATMILLALPRHPAARIRQIIDTCASCRVRFKIIPAFTPADERLSATMLNDVAPEDLLPRAEVAFDHAEIRSLVSGKRALVTGAGGSIGGEMCRQLAANGVQQLVMIDMNENELYLRARRLAEDYPAIDVHAEVVDVREPDRLQRLGARYHPQHVFHAAAHKHVPLMEDAPEEAVKNNVFGTVNVARMADACGAERLVLISTDKAVNPTSVMGATKRVAELVVRDLARTSRTRMTAVRFGNVLGSAGSVVPLFKQQIERGGPLTVTHPDCARYFMTIPEAVGLVLVAGLGAYGELCILDMGEPILIAELARIMVALAGAEVGIVYTGLRPGEKLREELLTEEEEQTHAVRDRIQIARSPAPPLDLAARLAELKRHADRGDGEAVISALKGLVPTYRRPADAPAVAEAPRRAPEVRPLEPRPRTAPVPALDLAVHGSLTS
jgi:FlaA1/EpsC-like NDP-sugar epimerase